jgi:molybdopterin converting factor small subunit
MQIQVELLGLSRLVTGKKELTLEIPEGTTFRDITRMLSDMYPALIGNVIQSDRESLQAPNIYNLNARRMIQTRQLGECPSEGDHIILMSMSAGG